MRKRGKDVDVPMWDYQRVGFHAFRHACGTLLHAMEDASSRRRVGSVTRS